MPLLMQREQERRLVCYGMRRGYKSTTSGTVVSSPTWPTHAPVAQWKRYGI